jgi:hypothetical protein
MADDPALRPALFLFQKAPRPMTGMLVAVLPPG